MNKDIMREIGFGEAVDMIEAGICPGCGETVLPSDFRDALSEREWGISGLCQSCQDAVFGKDLP